MKDIGIKLTADGEKAFNNALRDMNSGLKLLNTELKATSSQFLDNNKSVKSYTEQNKVLAKQIDAQKEKVAFLKDTLNQATQAWGESDKRTKAWASKLNTAQAELNKMEHSLKNNNSELDKYSSFTAKTADSVGKLDKEMSVLKNELDGVDKKYKGSSNSAEALGEKQRILTDIFGKQSEKVKTLKDAMETSKNAFGAGAEETKKFEKALAATEGELKTTERELKNVDTAMIGAGKSTKTFGEVLKANLTADAIKAGLKKLGSAVKDVGDYVMGGIKSASSFGREMSAMSEKTGISTQVLQKFNAAAKMTEVDVETFTKSYAKSIKSMNAATDSAKGMGATYAKLGVNVRDAGGHLRDSETVFWETVDALKNMDNETERNATSMQIFGKNALELNPIIKRGSEGFQDLTKNVATFDDQTMESLRGLNISMQKFEGVMDGIKRSIGVAFAPMMKEIADAAANAGGKLRGLFTAIAKGEDQDAINKKFEEFKNSVVQLAEKIAEQMPKFIEVGGKIIGALWEGLMTAFAPILPQIAGWGLLVAAGFAAWSALIATAIAAWPVMIGIALTGVLVMFWPQISKWATELWANITKFFKEHWQDMLLWITSWPIALMKTLNDMGVWEKLGSWLKGIWDNIAKWFKDLKDNAVQWTKDMWNSVIDWFKKLPGDIWNAIVGAIQKVKDWGKNLWNAAKDASKNVWNAIVDGIKSLPNEIGKIGENLVKGLWNGISNMTQWIKDKIFGFAKGITDSIKKFFGIQSPSKLFRDEVGKNLALGISEGFSKEMNNVAKNMQSALPGSFDFSVTPEINSVPQEPVQTSTLGMQSAMMNDMDFMVSAFKKALIGTAVMMDGDKMGEFVVSTTEKVVFA